MHFTTEGFPHDVTEQWALTRARFSEWVQDELLGFKWWVLLILFIITIYLWWKKADKARLAEMVFYTALIVIFIIILDELGEEWSLWYYKVDLFPLFPPITAIDISCMPLVYMLIYQHTRTWKSFILATIVMSAVFCFIFEPIFVLGGVYQMLTWKSYYGFPIYIIIAIISRFIVIKIFPVPAKSKTNTEPS